MFPAVVLVQVKPGFTVSSTAPEQLSLFGAPTDAVVNDLTVQPVEETDGLYDVIV
ncbi:hypothetical protein [Chryseobacterium sp. Leaf394]|uniref:hypothetical protein n=1 Tax=Chryseobacterium sp. Leaf394 TaxID=1736361 RepID=UPI0016139BC7|nr:hypothetical protein [Chryseobacterium sp. Leaf394]